MKLQILLVYNVFGYRLIAKKQNPFQLEEVHGWMGIWVGSNQ